MIFETQAQQDERLMRLALSEAREAFRIDEIPIGAVIAVNGRVIAKAHNLTETLGDVTAHAEMLAITAAEEALGGKYLPDCTLYVTVEPCPMCAGAIGWAQLGRVVWGAPDTKRGFRHFASTPRGPLHPKCLISEGLLADEAASLMKSFFKAKR